MNELLDCLIDLGAPFELYGSTLSVRVVPAVERDRGVHRQPKLNIPDWNMKTVLGRNRFDKSQCSDRNIEKRYSAGTVSSVRPGDKPDGQQIEGKSRCWSDTMRDNRAGLYSIGDFAGFCEYVGTAKRQADCEKRWRLMMISDGLGSRDLDLMHRMQIEMYRPLVRSLAYVPTNKLSRAQRNRPIRPLREKIEPFFPGYAFLTFSETDDRWREVFKMVGIRGLVCANHNPVEVPWKMIEEIQAKEIDGAVPSTTKLIELPYILGERIRITKGAFAAFDATIDGMPAVSEAAMGNMTLEELDESFKVKLLVELFGRSNSISLPLSDIQKL